MFKFRTLAKGQKHSRLIPICNVFFYSTWSSSFSSHIHRGGERRWPQNKTGVVHRYQATVAKKMQTLPGAIGSLTRWGLNEMADVLQTQNFNPFFFKMFEFRVKFQWFCSQVSYPNSIDNASSNDDLVHWRISASTDSNELTIAMCGGNIIFENIENKTKKQVYGDVANEVNICQTHYYTPKATRPIMTPGPLY